MLGQRLGGKYLIQSEIGRGGMGIVYQAHDEPLQRRVAVKVLDPRLALEPRFVRRFQQEAVAAANLRHPNIITIHDVGQEAPSADDEAGLYYIVMDLVAGVTLEQWVAKRGPMSVPQAKHVLSQLASALDYAHARGMIHCDIKPGNIMIDPAGHVTLMDFGLVRAREAGEQSRVGGLGTPEYMAPEQAVGGVVDTRTDTYALGVVLYKLLAGRTPFERSTPVAIAYAHAKEPPPPLRQLRSDLPKEVEAVVLKALSKRPDERYQTAGALAQDFSRAAAGQAGLARPSAALAAGRGRRPTAQMSLGAGRSRVPAVWLAISGLLLVVIVVGILWTMRNLARSPAPETAGRPQETALAPSAAQQLQQGAAGTGPTTAPAAVVAASTSTPSRQATPTLTPRPTFTATPTVERTTTPTAPAATPTAKPASAAAVAPRLLAPNADITGAGPVTFSWQVEGELAQNQGFEVRIWKEGNVDHPGAAQPVTQPARGPWRQVIDVGQAPAVQAGGSGTYFWTVALVEIQPYRRLGPEASPRRMYFGG